MMNKSVPPFLGVKMTHKKPECLHHPGSEPAEPERPGVFRSSSSSKAIA